MSAPPPAYTRQTVMCAADMLKALGHSGLGRFLLELDLPSSDIGSGSGLMERATSLATFAIKNPEFLTPERRTLSYEIILRASQIWRDGPVANLGRGEAERFAAAMARDGQPLKQAAEDAESRVRSWAGTNAPTPRPAAPASRTPQTGSQKVFIVHGRDDATRDGVAGFVRSLGLEAVILHERPNKGRTIITKFQEEAADIGFAVVLMTPDDHGGIADGPIRARARQNVIFELGFFIGAVGPAKVAALVKGDIERPSDFDGVVYIPLEGNWKIDLARELSAAGLPVDTDKIFGS